MDDIQEKVLNELKKGKSVKEAASVINTIPLIVDRWIRLGKKGEEEYVEFYEEYRKIILKETTEKTNNTTNSKEISDNEKLVDRFLKLLEINVNYEDIPNILDIPDTKMNNLYNQGKFGIEPYDKLYNAIEQAKKRQKINDLKDNKTKVKKTSDKIDSLNKKNKKCVVCGKELSKYTSKDKCKTCSRSIYVANILNDLLNFINPEIPFFKEDLRKLDYNDVEIKGIIWTLIDFDLIEKEKNNRYSLKNKKVLDDFLSEWEDYIVKTTENGFDNRKKLVKTCKVCKKELSTSKFSPSENSADGLKDYCKDCAKQVDAAKSLKIILNYVNAEEEFFKEDLYQYYPETFLVEATIFSLQENDLIDSNFEEMTYSLKDETTINEFLDKYLVEEPKIPKKSIDTQKPKHITQQPEPESGEVILEEKMDMVLKALKEGKSRKEAFKLIDENSSLLITWKLLGKKGTKPYDYFYEEYSKIKKPTKTISKKAETFEEQEELNKFISWKNKRDLFIKEIKEGKTFKEASKSAKLNEKLVNRWLGFGKNNKEYYIDFANEYKDARETAESKKEEEKNNAKNQVIAYIKQGYTLEEAAEEIKTFSSGTIIGWYHSGRKGEKSNKEFYEKCEVANQPENKRFGEIKFTNDLSLNLKLNIFIEEVKEGNTIRQSSKTAKLEEKNVIKFINYGKRRIKPYTKFAEEYIKARDISEEREKEKRKIAKNKTVEYIKQGYDLRTAVTKVEEFSDGTILGWHLSGRRGNENHKQFYKDCEKALIENEIKSTKITFVNDTTLNKKLNIFINEIIDGKSIKEASKKANINEKLINKYISDGKRRIEPYTRFAEEYIEARKYVENKKEERKNNAKDQVIKYIEQGYTLEESAEKVKTFSSGTIIGWYNSGKRGEKSHKQFYIDCEYIKKHKSPKKTIQTRITDTKLSDKENNYDTIDDHFNLTIKEDNANKKLWEILIEGETNYTNFISILSNLEYYKNQLKKIMTENNGKNRLKVLIKLNIDKKEAQDMRKLANIIDDIKSKIKIE